MAKNPSLTVKVDSQQFKDFAKSFNDLTAKMQAMTQQWKALSDNINKSTSHIDRVTSSIRTAGKHLSDFSGTTTKITKSIAKWGGMIGGIVTMLGGGAMFGMDRIAQRMVDQRRRLLGLGGADYGRTQAFETFGKGMLDDPKGVLTNISKGKFDITSEQYRGMLMAGISQEDIRKKKPEELAIMMAKEMAKHPMEGPLTLPMAKARQETSIFSEQDVVRLHGKGGADFVKTLENRMKAAGGLTDADLKVWEKFWESITNFKTKIDTEWTKALEPLAPAGSKLIEVLTNMTTKFAEFVTSMGFIQTIANGIEWLAKFMEQPSWKSAWEGLSALLKSLVTPNKGVLEKMDAYKQAYQERTGIIKPGEAAKPSFLDYLWGRNQPAQAPTAPAAPAAPAASVSSWTNSIRNFLTSPVIGGNNQTTAPSQTTTGGPRISVGGFSLPGAMPAPFQFSSPPAGGGGGATPAPLPGSTPTPFKFSSAVSAMAPSKVSAVNNISSTVLAGLQGGGGGSAGGGQAGAMNVDNWQSSRISSLVVRNVPGSNVFMSAAGMVG